MSNHITVKDLRCEYRINPLGIDLLIPRLCWKLDSSVRGARQFAYQLIAGSKEISSPQDPSLLWDTGKVKSDQSIQVPYGGPALKSRQRIYWRVRVWDAEDQSSSWSDLACFEMGLLKPGDWRAEWIANDQVGDANSPAPCPYFRKRFVIDRKIQNARLYITSQGIYEGYINGQRVGEDFFTPGWTDYNKRVQYQTYDVTEMVSRGENTIGIVLGDGWYCGHIAWFGRQNYGDRPKALAQLEIAFENDSTQQIVTDCTWETASGPILTSDLIMGENYDARLEIEGWCTPRFLGGSRDGGGTWSPVKVIPHPEGLALVAQNTPTVRPQGELSPLSNPVPSQNRCGDGWLFDFGQNLVGRVRLKVAGERGRRITMRFGEMLTDSGELYTENLRSACQTDIYTLDGNPGGEVYESHFTIHGFRYVHVQGLPGKPSRDTLTAIILHTDNPNTLQFESSDPLLNRLHQNIKWGWKGNSLDVPTDCPQRDERLGWTGDAQVFVKTATYLSDSASFFSKWVQDLADAQLDYGAIPSFAPNVSSDHTSDGGPAWSDAFIIVPWTIWQQYGDTRILNRYYDFMCTYMEYLVKNSPGLIRLLPNEEELGEGREEEIGGYGDWLAMDGSEDRRGLTPKSLIGTAFLAYDAALMAQIADALGKIGDAEKFRHLFQSTKKAFQNEFFSQKINETEKTQTSFILALHFDLVTQEKRVEIQQALIKDIESRNVHISTGFVGTPYILYVLANAGRLDMAYRLLFQKTFPSWLYPVLHGATTIWERWDGWTKDGGFQDPAMNSFNHYAYGAVGAWMYETILGIKPDPAYPGFKHFILCPQIRGNLAYAQGEFNSPHGLIKSSWKLEEDAFFWEVVVPPNTSATAYVPTAGDVHVLEGNIQVEDAQGVTFIKHLDNASLYELEPGLYRFEVR